MLMHPPPNKNMNKKNEEKQVQFYSVYWYYDVEFFPA